MQNITYKTINNLNINIDLYNFINNEVVPGLNIKAEFFFTSLQKIINKTTKENISLLEIRNNMQQKIDNWHINNKQFNFTKYKKFLKNINYLQPEPANFVIKTSGVDAEIKNIAGPQLVVPITNARFTVNAINARWGSLYNALYNSDVIKNKDNTAIGDSSNAPIKAEIIKWSNNFLDKTLPLINATYSQLQSIHIKNYKPVFFLKNNKTSRLKNSSAFIASDKKGNLLMKHNNLHIELLIDKNTHIIKDVILESAISTIVDFEDSVVTVSSEEKIQAYRNFLGLIKQDLQATFKKNGKVIIRKLNKNKTYTTPAGKRINLSGTSVILTRNVGLHMFSDIIKNNNNHISESTLDAMITTLIAMHGLKNKNRNSKINSIYIVKPKLHGADEVAFTVKLFTEIEKSLGLKINTIKIGIMDEERRTSVNLKTCIKAAKNRIIFINTGFLDRTGDEIHTNMLAGAVPPKNTIKNQKWIKAYEKLNVAIGLECGFYKKAQIGKGMWPKPDNINEMLIEKIDHLKMGASCSWVPSPTTAILHTTHYHQIDVFKKQIALNKNKRINRDELLAISLIKDHTKLSKNIITKELDNNVQSILGYVVKWVDQGIGCSKVADINHINLMEDRATLRISSQHIANWLEHKILNKEQIIQSFKKMAILVDEQNKNDQLYVNIAPNYTSYAFKASLKLVFKAKEQLNGYTEDILKKYRQKVLLNSSN